MKSQFGNYLKTITSLIFILLTFGCSHTKAETDQDQQTQLVTADAWHGKLSIISYTDAPNAKALIFQLYDKNNTPLEGATVTMLARGVDTTEYLGLKNMQETASGSYFLRVEFQNSGTWKFQILSVRGNQKNNYESTINIKLDGEDLGDQEEKTTKSYTPSNSWKTIHQVQPFDSDSLKTATTFYLFDNNGKLIEGAEAFLVIESSSDGDTFRKEIELAEFSSGEYTRQVDFPAPGEYKLTFIAKINSETFTASEKTLIQ